MKRVTWLHSNLKIMQNHMGLNLKSGVDLSPAYLDEFAYVGWLGGQEAVMQEAELRSL